MIAAQAQHRPQLDRMSWLLLAGCTVASLDLLFAAAWWSTNGVGMGQILQVIASWLIGRELAGSGGLASIAVGAALHYALLTAIAAGYFRMARAWPALLDRPLRSGAIYGACMYVLMFFVLVPALTGNAQIPQPLDWQLACFAAYALLVGIPCALFARAALDTAV